jgi:hypothetical protein
MGGYYWNILWENGMDLTGLRQCQVAVWHIHAFTHRSSLFVHAKLNTLILRYCRVRAAAHQLRQDKHQDVAKDAVLLHSWFRLESAHRRSTCLRLITSSLVDDMTSSSEEDILMSITYTGAVPWVLISESWRTEKEHAESCCTCLQHDSDRCAAVFIISFVSTVLLSLRHVADIVSWLLHVLTHAGVRPN